MSDPQNPMLKILFENQERLRQTMTREDAALYLPWSQRALNPIAATGIWGDMGLPWAAYLLAFYASIYVATTNDATNYWTVTLSDAPASTTLASFDTKTVTASLHTRITPPTITQPTAGSVLISITATKTLSPGALWLWPAVALLRTG